MTKALKVKIGHLDCEHCKTEVPVRKNEATGALSFSCHECGKPGYAKNDGSDYYRNMLAAVRPLATSQDVPPGAPAAPKPATAFG